VRSTNADVGSSAWSTIVFNTTATVGTADVLQSASVVGGVLKGTATIRQSLSPVSTKIEVKAMPSGTSVNWAGSKIVPAFPGETITTDVTVTGAGNYDLFARSVAADGTTGAVSGPRPFAATATIQTGGSNGSGLGGTGLTINEQNHPLYGGSGFNGSYHPLYGGSFGGGGSSSNGGGSIY
jgi:hypothetical protein